MSRLRTPWIKHVSVSPELFVSRTKERERLKSLLDDRILYKTRSALVLIGGERGIGKSIFARTVLADVAKKYPNDVITLVVPGRMKSLINIMREYAKELVKAARALAPPPGWLPARGKRSAGGKRLAGGKPSTGDKQWFDILEELACNEQITRQTSTNVGREVGADSELSGGIWTFLQGKGGFQWTERREQGKVTELSLTVTPMLLVEAINAGLAALSEHITVLVFFDDLDQASGMDTAENAKNVLDIILGLGPAIHLVHLQSEKTFADVRREHDDYLSLRQLSAEELNEILRHRAASTLEDDRRLVHSTAGWEPLRRLCASTGNPLVLLRWVKALADHTEHWPPPEDWMSPEQLRQLAMRAAGVIALKDEYLRRFGNFLDRLAQDGPFTEDDLRAGRRSIGPSLGEPLSDDLIACLLEYKLILPEDRFNTSRGFRIDPIISLVRPSIGDKIRSS